jgi:hypothetical protein
MEDQDQPGLVREASGKQQLGLALRMLLTRNGLSHGKLKAFYEWGSPGQGSWLATSQISYVRTGAGTKGVGSRVLDALGQANLHLALLAGDDSPEVVALPNPGLLPDEFELLRGRAWFLRHPLTGLAMNAGDLFMVLMGRLIPAELDRFAGFSERECRKLSEALALLGQQWCAERGLLLLQGFPQLIKMYPVESKIRQDRLRLILAGVEVFAPEQFTDELQALGILVGAILGKDNALTPAELLDQLHT